MLLKLLKGNADKNEFTLSDNSVYVIGRSDKSDIVLKDKRLSREHCKIEIREGVPIIYDMSSSNGTYINKKKSVTAALTDGDKIHIGHTIFKFYKNDISEAPTKVGTKIKKDKRGDNHTSYLQKKRKKRFFKPSRHSLTLDQLRLIIARAIGISGTLSKDAGVGDRILDSAIEVLTERTQLPQIPDNALLTDYVAEWEKYYSVRKISELSLQTAYKSVDRYLKKQLMKCNEEICVYFFYHDSIAKSLKKKEFILDEFITPVIQFLLIHTISVRDSDEAISKLSRILNYLPGDFAAMLHGREFLIPAKNLTNAQVLDIERLDLPGVYIESKAQTSPAEMKAGHKQEFDLYVNKGLILMSEECSHACFLNTSWPEMAAIEKSGKTLLFYPFLSDALNDGRKLFIPHIELDEVMNWEMLFAYIRHVGIINMGSDRYFPKDIIKAIDDKVNKRAGAVKSPLLGLKGTALEALWEKAGELMMGQEKELTYNQIDDLIKSQEIDQAEEFFEETMKEGFIENLNSDEESEASEREKELVESLSQFFENNPGISAEKVLSNRVTDDIKLYIKRDPNEILKDIFSRVKKDARNILANEIIRIDYELEQGAELILTNIKNISLNVSFCKAEKDRVWVETKSGDRGYYILANLKAMDMPNKDINTLPFQYAEAFKENVKSLFSKEPGRLEEILEEKSKNTGFALYIRELIGVEHNILRKDRVLVKRIEKEPTEYIYNGIVEVKSGGKRLYKIALQLPDEKQELFNPEEIDGFEKQSAGTGNEDYAFYRGYRHPDDIKVVIEELLNSKPLRLFRRMEDDENLSLIEREGFTTMKGDGSTASKPVLFDLMPPALDTLGIDEQVYIMIEGFRVYDGSNIAENKLPQDYQLIKQGYDAVFFYKDTRLGSKEQVKVFDGAALKGDTIKRLINLY